MEGKQLSVHRVNLQILELHAECLKKLALGFREIPAQEYCIDARAAVAISFIKDGYRCRAVSGHTMPNCPCDVRQVCEGQLHLQFSKVQ